MSSVKKLVIRGTLWTIAGYGTSQVLRFASNLILTRLLSPELFGLMALGNVFIIGLHLFSDIGIGTSIIQNKRGDEPNFLNTAWTMQVIRGMGLWLCCLLIAWPISALYGEPNLLWLIPALGFNTVINGFNSTSLFTLNRKIALGKLAFFELGGQVISTGVIVTWAWFNPTIWALVAGSFVAATIQLIWSHFLIPGRPNHLFWERESAQSIFSFGKWIFASTALTFMSEQADKLILGMLIPISVLGIYNIAFTLADLPRQVLLALSGKVIFPAFSRLADLPRAEFRAKILQNRRPFLFAATFGVTALAGFGDILFSVLYPAKYDKGIWMLPLLAIGFWPRILTQTIDQSLFAIGKSRYPAYGSFFKFLYMAIGLPLVFHLMGGERGYGLQGALIVVALNDVPFYFAILYGLWREGLSSIRQDLQATLLFAALIAVVLVGRNFTGLGLPFDTMF